jgi:hypothetical protein
MTAPKDGFPDFLEFGRKQPTGRLLVTLNAAIADSFSYVRRIAWGTQALAETLKKLSRGRKAAGARQDGPAVCTDTWSDAGLKNGHVPPSPPDRSQRTGQESTHRLYSLTSAPAESPRKNTGNPSQGAAFDEGKHEYVSWLSPEPSANPR